MNRHTASHTAIHTMDEAANSIGTLVEQGKELADSVRDKAMAGAKATHKAVTENPYKAVGIALGIGAILGFARPPWFEQDRIRLSSLNG